ncbi:hypothetical protein ES707_15274 [subsurface metagenome]
MNLSPDMQKRFIDEVNFVIKNMKNTDNPTEKLYFFSAGYAMAQRIINLEYEPELAFIQQVLQLVYNMVNARLLAMSMRQEAGVSIPDGLFSSLEEALEEMVDRIEQGVETYPALQRIVNLAYSTTGNGYYLYLKGLLKV